MMLTICILQKWNKLVSFQLKIHLNHYSFFDDFRYEKNVRYRSVVFQVLPIKILFFQKWTYKGMFETSWKHTRRQ